MSAATAPAPAISTSARTASGPLLASLAAIVGKKYLLTGDSETRHYRTGFRFGAGKALAVVRPGSLVEQWRVLKACINANVIVICQASNTGLTGGSTPDGGGYDRDIVIVSMTRMKKIHLIEGATQVVCLPGATLNQLEDALRPFGREPHSVIGSSCIGASVLGGICNNSGGALVRRGPAYTEMSVFAKVDQAGRLHLVNHLGIRLGGSEEEVLARLERGDFAAGDVIPGAGAGHDTHYASRVRAIDEPTPARFNADPRLHHESSGSAGKVMVFAVRLDTFPIEDDAHVFYIGTNDTRELTAIRRAALGQFAHLPISGEYLHRSAYAMAEKYGKDTFLMIQHLGTPRLPMLFALKARLDALFSRIPLLPPQLADRLLQAASRLFPHHLPARMRKFHGEFEHHLLLKVGAAGADEARAFLAGYFAKAGGSFFECTPEEGEKAFLHRFVVGGASIRYRALFPDEVEDIVALDIALPRNDRDWFDHLPPELEASILLKSYCAHFLCHVFHNDYFIRKDHDADAVKRELLKLLDQRGAEYPAEHNVGHLYEAKPALREHYAKLDPCNCFNPGIGHTSKFANYREPGAPD